MPDTHPESSVSTLREQFLEQLKRDIDTAFLNSQEVDVRREDGQLIFDELIDEMNEEAKYLRSQDGKDIVQFPEPRIGSNFVEVTNPYDFKDLLTLTYKRIGVKDENVSRFVEEDLAHEYAHHAPLLGESGVKIKYGVSFLKDSKKDAWYIQPFIHPSGSVSRSVYEQVLHRPSELSSSDRNQVKALRHPFPRRIVKKLIGRFK